MDLIVLNKYGRAYKLNEEVVVTNPKHSMYDKWGKICAIRNFDGTPKISVRIDGHIYRCTPEDIMI
jgi:hypothetical protein